ncbi:MAG: presenilin family intramembrane aspartyl protease [Candidatus Pacearchaeota archaeon]|nr:presenilin family intramembrane aspartyl protease [Candidatus Pacearchaeota archaeon]
MKHNLKITALLLAMFIVTQFIGIYVVSYYSPVKIIAGEKINVSAPSLPFGLEPPQPQTASDYTGFFSSIVVAFIIAVVLLFMLTKFKWELILKIWFFVVIVLALSLALIAIFSIKIALIAVIIALPLAALKFYGKSFIVHNLTELLIYPGIAAVFVPLLNVWTVIALLILISIYDIWAVWHSGIMQKMAKYQINTLKVFSGFFVPYVSKKVKSQIKLWKKTLLKTKLNKKKIKVNVAILGGGDIVFPIITAGVMLKTLGLVSAIFVIIGATLGLAYLFFAAEKRKFYPAMPFITAGILVGILASYLIL